MCATAEKWVDGMVSTSSVRPACISNLGVRGIAVAAATTAAEEKEPTRQAGKSSEEQTEL